MPKVFRQLGSVFSRWFAPARRWFYWMYTVQNRERKQLLEEATQMRELMPLLMKQRNGHRWTRDERARIRAQLRRLSRMSPYLVPLLMPGGFLILPIVAWWMDRRRLKRTAEAEAERSPLE